MKLLSVFTIFAIVLLTNGQSISDQMRNAIEAFRDNMPCMEPPMAPMDIEHMDINLDFDGLSTTGHVYNVTVEKLNEFDIEFVHFTLAGLRMTFTFYLEEVPTYGMYVMNGMAAGRFPFSGAGAFHVIAKRITFHAVSSMNLVDGFLNMRNFDPVMTVEDFYANFENLISENGMTQEFLNRVLEKMALEIMVLHQEAIAEQIGLFVMPIVNAELNNMTIGDLLDNIANPPAPAEPCIPPTVKLY